MNKKICFLFGAGAEGEKNFGLPTGTKFMAASFLDDSLKNTLFTALGESLFTEKYFNCNYNYSKHSYYEDRTFKSIFKKWIFYECQSEDIYETYKADIKAVLNKDEFHELLRTINSNKYDSENGKENRETEYESIAENDGNKLLKDLKSIIKSSLNESNKNKKQPNKNKELGDFGGQITERFIKKDEIKNKYKYKIKDYLPTGIAHIVAADAYCPAIDAVWCPRPDAKVVQ